MNFRIAIIKCFMLYAIFSGRAKRAEFWWFFLFCMIVGLMGSVIDAALGSPQKSAIDALDMGEFPGVALVITDGKVRVNGSQCTLRSRRVAEINSI